MTDIRGQSGKRQAEARDTAVAPENAGKGGLPGEKRILKPGDNCVIRTISVRSSMKIIYYLMAADGRIFHNEQEKYEEIGRGLDPGFDAVRDEIIASCDPEPDSSLEPEAYMHSLMDGIRAAVLEGINQENASIAPKVLVWDLLIIDQYGDFHVIMEPSRKKLDSWIQKNVTEGELQIVNTFNFGPVLIADGQTTSQNFNKALNCDHIGANKLAQRMCICQMDHLTYMIVTSEGPDNEKGAGLTLNEFVGCLREIEGKLDGYRIKTAFNMDGGNSATLVFKDPDRNQLIKINGQNNQNAERWIKDILYFASAWNQ